MTVASSGTGENRRRSEKGSALVELVVLSIYDSFLDKGHLSNTPVKFCAFAIFNNPVTMGDNYSLDWTTSGAIHLALILQMTSTSYGLVHLVFT